MRIKRLIFRAGLLLGLLPCFVNPLFAENTKEDYLIKRDYYLKRHQDYTTAKQTYLNYRTLQTKEDLIQKLREFLIARNEFLREYLLLLLDRGKPFLPENDFVEIRTLINWLDQETKQAGSIKSLEELVSFSGHLKERYPEIEKTIFIFLTKLTIGQQNVFVEKITQLMAEIDRDLQKSGQDLGSVSHWLDEVGDRLLSIKEKQELALKLIEETRTGRIGMAKASWQKSAKLLLEADFQLKEVVGFLDEIITALD